MVMFDEKENDTTAVGVSCINITSCAVEIDRNTQTRQRLPQDVEHPIALMSQLEINPSMHKCVSVPAATAIMRAKSSSYGTPESR